jgi:hypothetical protein
MGSNACCSFWIHNKLLIAFRPLPHTGGGIYEYEPVLLDLLQNYSGLSAERLNSLLANSPKAAG